jgi:hypothetical protein
MLIHKANKLMACAAVVGAMSLLMSRDVLIGLGQWLAFSGFVAILFCCLCGNPPTKPSEHT